MGKMTNGDLALLRQYARNHSEAAFIGLGQQTNAKPWNDGLKELESKSLDLTFTLEAGQASHIIVGFRNP